MYLFTAYPSHADAARGAYVIRESFALRGQAIEAREACPYPVADVIDIGEAGRCPARPLVDGQPQGHAFEFGLPADRCRFCRAPDSALYIRGTYLPKPPDHDVPSGCRHAATTSDGGFESDWCPSCGAAL